MYKLVVISCLAASSMGVELGTYGGTIDGHGISLDVGSKSNGITIDSVPSFTYVGIDESHLHPVNKFYNSAYSLPQQANQYVTPEQANLIGKNYVAQKVINAATTVHEALLNKQSIVENLQNKAYSAQQHLQSEHVQYTKAQEVARAVQTAADQAKAQVNVVNAALGAAQINAQQSSQVAVNAETAVSAQNAMILEAQQRVAILTQKLHRALSELQQTEMSAKTAIASAQIAQANVFDKARKITTSGKNTSSGGKIY